MNVILTVIFAVLHVVAACLTFAAGALDIVLAVVGGAMLTGIFFEQVGSSVMRSRSQAYGTWGMRVGGWFGLAFAIYGIYAFGVLLTLLGVAVLCIVLFAAGFFTWLVCEPRYNQSRGCA